MSRHAFAPADAAWLRMDRPTNLMVVTSVMWFEDRLDRHALRQLIEERVLARFPRFRQRVVEEGGLFWEDVEDFDVEEHLHAVRLLGHAGQAELETFTSAMVSVPLPRSRPMWDLYLVEEYGPGSAVVFRMHHAIADGIALSRVLLSLTDEPGVNPVAVTSPSESEETAASLAAGVARAAGDLIAHPWRAVEAFRHPAKAAELARTAVADASALASLALLPSDRSTALRGRVGVAKQVVWSAPVPLAEVRDAGHRTGTTVNDLLLAAVAGALRSHLVRLRSPVRDVRAIVPFNLRPLDRPLPAELGNQFGLVYLPLPLTLARREDRLHAVAEHARRTKQTAQGLVSYAVLELVGRAPGVLEDVAIDLFAAKGTGVMTNVPGPRRQVTLAGARLAGTIGWGPTSGELGLGVALFSYAGSLVIGLCVDEELVPGPAALLRDVLDELDALLALPSSE